MRYLICFSFVILIFGNCSSDGSMSEKELELKERELALKEKEMAPSDNSAYDKGYDTGFNAGYEDGLKKAEEQNQQALEETIELGYQEGKEKYLKEKGEEPIMIDGVSQIG